MILVTTDTTTAENRIKAIRQAHAAKREFGRIVAEELPRALLAETKFRAPIDPAKGIRAALKGGDGAIAETEESATGVTVTTGIQYAKVPHLWIADRGGTITAKNVRNLTIPVDDAAAMELYKAGSVRNIPGLDFAVIGGKAALVRDGEPRYWLKHSVKRKGQPYIAPGVERFRRTSWRRLLETLPAMMTN